MDFRFFHPENFFYLWLALLVAGFGTYAALAQRKAWRNFVTRNLYSRMTAGQSSRNLWTKILPPFCLILITFALADPRWGKTWKDVPQRGIEVVFALDVSRSMLAEDTPPNRLERAKQMIKDAVDQMAGDRVGLVVFSGEAKRQVPLTQHYHDFKQSLDEVNITDINRGGSNLALALKVSADAFLEKSGDHKAIVLITDGEDHESGPLEVAQQLHREHGIRVFTIGLGDQLQGSRIPTRSADNRTTYLQHDGQTVLSKMDGQLLSRIATETSGAFVPAGTRQVDMGAVYQRYISTVEQQEFESARVEEYTPRFQWFLTAAISLLALDTFLRARRPAKQQVDARRPRHPSDESTTAPSVNPQRPSSTTPDRPAKAVISASVLFAIAVATLGTSQTAKAGDDSVRQLAEQGRQALKDYHYDEAEQFFQQALAKDGNNHVLQFNKAVVHYRQDDLRAARDLFTAAVQSPDTSLQAKAHFNLGNCDLREALAIADDVPETAEKQARSALSHFRDAIAADPLDADARANIELAQRLIDQLIEKQKQQQDQQQQDQQQQDQQQQDQQQQDQQ
ncbi:MAG: VWA domain-containing protein, partial [Planctomycetales bacterium]|nr:VWA domain-containing protein [Planctomycetales bacterium]